MYYDLLSPTPPPLPQRLPGFVSYAISQVPNYVKPAAAQALFPPVAAQIYDVTFRYLTNKLHESVCCMEGCVADSGVGKGYLTPMIAMSICQSWFSGELRRGRRVEVTD